MRMKAYSTLLGVVLLLISAGFSSAASFYMAKTVSTELADKGKVTAGGTIWNCKGGKCVTRADWTQPDMDACMALAREVGPLSYFGLNDGSVSLGENELEKCNSGGDLTPLGAMRKGVTVLLGTYEWDIDKNRLESAHTADLWLNHVDSSTMQLVPRNGARIALIGHTNCLELGPRELSRGTFRVTPIDDSNVQSLFRPGTVFAVITNSRKLAKLCIRGFKSSHDFNFREATLLTDRWIDMAKHQPRMDRYHIKFFWTIYDDIDPLSLFEAPE